MAIRKLPSEDESLNLNPVELASSRGERYPTYNSSLAAHPYIPRGTEEHEADDGITSRAWKGTDELSKWNNKTRYSSPKTFQRRELRQEEEIVCNRAKMDYEEGINSRIYAGHVHKVTTTVTIIVKDINDNAPIFPENVMMGEVQENGQFDVSVARISAWDADDSTEGLNGRVTYSIEKNVIDEETGKAIFNVDSNTGIIKTAICCLDRETTPEYQIQVVATDGGGLKGTGTVIIRIGDDNDNSPEFPSERFELEMDETWGNGDPDPITPLMEVTCFDPDVNNDFLYRIIERSGLGWDYFDVRSEGRVGQLYARRPLDYENPLHRRELAFKIQVTDMGKDGWTNPAHVDTAWVKVQILDVNDNAPTFDTTHAQISIMENTPKGTILGTFHAHDLDKGENGLINYKITNLEDVLEIDDEGVVRIKTDSFDRESLKVDAPIINILGVDRGQPPLTSTATLSLSVLDVNDSPPYLLPPTVFHIQEGAPPTRLGLLRAYDEDKWSLGNGPPFNISFAPMNPKYIQELIDLQFSKKLDSGRGAATLWTRKPIDREEHQQLDIRVKLTDARGLSNAHTVTVVVDDLNDNPMKPGRKTIYLYKIQDRGGRMNVPLGRVFVEDPDDWDLKDKTFEWATSGHPLFTLDQQDGTIYASSQVREGRYLLEFSVSDRVSRQRGVPANVTVIVKTLEYRTLLNAAPITLFPATPDKITKGWNPVEGGGVLGKLTEGILAIVGKEEHIPEVVSVYGSGDRGQRDTKRKKTEESKFSSLVVRHQQHSQETLASSSSSSSSGDPSPSAPIVSVWLTVRNRTGGDFMNPVKLKGLLSLHKKQLEISTGLNVTIEGMDNIYLGLKNKYRHRSQRKNQLGALKSRKKTISKIQEINAFAFGRIGDKESDNGGKTGKEEEGFVNTDFYTARYKADASGGPSTMASVSSSVIHLQVIDTNNTSLVTPRLKHFYDCKSPSMSQPRQEQACLPGSCLNGGRCVQFSDGKRCICPGGSVGFNCKVLSRSFMGSGWSWLPSIPPCFPSTMSLKILTQQREALLLYSGPIEIGDEKLPFLAIQLSDGYPELVTNSWAGRAKLQVGTRVNDGFWHTIHVRCDHWGLSMVTDACGQGWNHQSNDTHCATRALWTHPNRLGSWVVSSPLQVGGLAHDGDYQARGWAERPITQPLHGCVSHITINGELLDLGEPPFSQGSTPGCRIQEKGCVGEPSDCSLQEACQNELQEPRCICQGSFTGSECQPLSTPATLGPSSYYKVALSFTPSHYMLTLQIRMKAQGQPEGLLIHVADSHVQHSLSVQLHAGKACLEESRNGEKLQIVCIEGFVIGDNNWHLLRAERYGHNLKISIDDGDGFLQNESFPSLVTHADEDWVREMPVPLEVNKNDGITIGGMPEYTGTKLIAVHDDLQGVCIDDLRISGHRIPIPPGVNNSKWGQVTTQEGLLHGCVLPDICQNFSCKAPLTCSPTWPEPSCSCGYGLQYTGNACRDINECLWNPCLNGGTCHNLQPGYFCQCDNRFFGENCQFRKWDTRSRTFTAQALIATVTVSLLVIVLLCLILSIRHHCIRNQRSLQHQDKDQMRNNGDTANRHFLNGDKPGGGRRRISTAKMKTTTTTAAASEDVEVVIMNECPPDDPHLEFMERYRLSHHSSSLVDDDDRKGKDTECASNCNPRDQMHRNYSQSSHQRQGVHIATLSNGSSPG
ncbi:putative neural-cadherin 2 [Palaemon carinicauda]|uniref:putative neural-cadherin 2 n=1 Tax=Palaemon carinicauda TaxID=392227 RepID=UPI0035B5E8E5